MSSPRVPLPADGVVTLDNRPVGPLQMPTGQTMSFVAEFNATYASIGLRINPHVHERSTTSDEKENPRDRSK